MPCRYKDTAAVAFHKEQDHYKLWAHFKERGGVLSQDVVKMEGLMGAGM